MENQPGKLAEFTKLLERNNIDLRALSIADTQDFGILRVIVDDSLATIQILREAGYVCSVTPVLALEIPDQPGSLVKLLNILGDSGVNIEYTYAFLSRKKDRAFIILRVADNAQAIEVLGQNGIQPICQEEFAEIFE